MYTNKPFHLKQGDRRPYYEVELRQGDGTPVPDLDTAELIEFRMSHRHNQKRITGVATVLDPSTGLVQYQWADGDTSDEGEYLVSIRVMWADGVPQTFPSDGYKIIMIEEQVGV